MRLHVVWQLVSLDEVHRTRKGNRIGAGVQGINTQPANLQGDTCVRVYVFGPGNKACCCLRLTKGKKEKRILVRA